MQHRKKQFNKTDFAEEQNRGPGKEKHSGSNQKLVESLTNRKDQQKTEF